MNENELQNGAEPSHAEVSTPEAATPDTPALDDSLSAYVREEIERRFQSAKDKRWAELERQYGALAAHQPPDAEALRARAATLAGQADLLDDPATGARLAAPDWGLAYKLLAGNKKGSHKGRRYRDETGGNVKSGAGAIPRRLGFMWAVPQIM